MPIELTFLDKLIRELCEQQQTANLTLGPESARKLRARLADIQAAMNISDVAAGRQTPNGSDQLIFSLFGTDRFVLEPADSPVPRKADGAVEWVKVAKVCVVRVEKKND
jgi:toxin HigB-1